MTNSQLFFAYRCRDTPQKKSPNSTGDTDLHGGLKLLP